MLRRLGHTGVCMDTHMNDDRIESIAQLQAFLKGVDGTVTFRPDTKGNKNKQKMYDWLGKTLSKFRYWSVSKREKSIVLSFLETMTKRSRVQLKRLCARKKHGGMLLISTKRNSFSVRYGCTDIARLIETDNAHGRISGEATKRIMEREYAVHGKSAFATIGAISVAHLYRLRKNSRQYVSNILHIEKTRATKVNIGIRRKPTPFGIPGFLRVDSVHQGDLDKEKGVYHINLVDEVTQWEIVGCVEGISEEFLRPLLDELLAAFPFRVKGFHSDNGSEYINEVVAKLLTKLSIEQTKSRSRRTNDNALVEGKNASRIRKHMGYTHIPKKYASDIMDFYREHLNVYCNFHRPCGFATLKTDRRGKEKKKYDIYLTPFEKLCSLPAWETHLRPGVTAASLTEMSKQESDNECAKKLQEAKSKLFKTFAR
jgi:transposase InsO family protein